MSTNIKLPKGWKQVKLSEAGKIISGGTPSTAVNEYWNGDISWISPSDLTGYKNKTIKKGTKSITEIGLKNSSARLMPKGSVLFSSRAPIGYVVIADNELCTNQGFKSIIPYENVDSNFIYYYLKASKQRAEQVASGTTFKEISLKSFSELTFPLPPLPTQQAIVSKIEELFSELDNGIANLKTAQQQLKTYRQSVLKWAFEGKLTNKKVKDGELPKGWKMVKIADVSKVVRGGSPRPAGDPKFYNGNIPFLKVADLTKGDGIYLTTYTYTIKEAGLHKTRQIAPNTLLLSNSGATLGVPKICMINATMNDGVAAFLDLDIRSNHYLYYFWVSKTRELRNINMGAAQPNLNTDLIRDYDLPYCSFEEQQLIVQEIEL
jgi:type I restriction enzyme S subunit